MLCYRREIMSEGENDTTFFASWGRTPTKFHSTRSDNAVPNSSPYFYVTICIIFSSAIGSANYQHGSRAGRTCHIYKEDAYYAHSRHQHRSDAAHHALLYLAQRLPTDQYSRHHTTKCCFYNNTYNSVERQYRERGQRQHTGVYC